MGIPLARRRVGPNHLYGLRVPETLADEAVWYEANAVTGRDMVAVGAVTAVAAVGLDLVPGLGEDQYAVLVAGLLILGSLAMCLRGLRVARRLHAARNPDA
ncbi:MAG: SdpI family protein [Candidatus Krumholzibacteriia bacterium]